MHLGMRLGVHGKTKCNGWVCIWVCVFNIIQSDWDTFISVGVYN